MTSQQTTAPSPDLLQEDSLREAFSSVLALPKDSDWRSVRYGTTDGWDSIAHMQLVAELETKFNILLSTDEVIDLSTFDKARQTLEAHGIVFES